MDKHDYEGDLVFNVVFIEDNVKYSCNSSRVKDTNLLKCGDERLVRWKDGRYYKAIIKQIRSDGLINVKFKEDNVEFTTRIENVKHCKVQKGDIRNVKWDDGRYYPARIESIIMASSPLIEEEVINQELQLNTSDTQTTEEDNLLLTKDVNRNMEQALSPAKSVYETPPDDDEDGNQTVQPSEDVAAPQPNQYHNCHQNLDLSATLNQLPMDEQENDHHEIHLAEAVDPRPQQKLKRNFCIYCRTMQTKIGRHMASKHKDIPEVQLYLNTTDKDKKSQMNQRREICRHIINRSNKTYNDNIFKNDQLGKPIVTKKSKEEPKFETHITCSACGGLFSKKHFASHKKNCKKRQILLHMEHALCQPAARVMGQQLENKYTILQNKVLDKMNSDSIKSIILKDNLILEYGRRFLKSHMAAHQRNYVSNKMRTLADLVTRMTKIDQKIKNLKDCVDPTNFDLLCKTVKEWCQLDEDSGICQIGSVPRRLNKILKSCSQIIWTEAIKNKEISKEEQNEIRRKHKRFMSLMETDWTMEINSAADKSLKIKKVLGETKMPLKEDIILFFKILTTHIENYISKLKKIKTREYYDMLTQATLAYLIAFNSRRPGEVAYATISNFQCLELNENDSSDESLGVFNVAALKNDVKVPVIVTKTVLYAINTLLEFRATFNINSTLLFPNNKGTAYNGSDILYRFKSKMFLEKPEDFTANGLRHYWATVSQNNSEMKKHMPKFMGHTTLTHQKFYEMPMADIHLNLIGPLIRQQCLPSTIVSTNTDELECLPSTSTAIMEQDSNAFLSTVANEESDHRFDIDEEEDDDLATSSTITRSWKRWLTPEKEELFNNLPETVLGVKSAGRGGIKKVWENSTFIKKRHSLQMTRIEVSKYHTKKKKIPTPIKTNLMKRISKE